MELEADPQEDPCHASQPPESVRLSHPPLLPYLGGAARWQFRGSWPYRQPSCPLFPGMHHPLRNPLLEAANLLPPLGLLG